MTLRKALKTGKPIRLKGRTWTVTFDVKNNLSTGLPESWWFHRAWLSKMDVTLADALSKEWEVKK